MSIPWFLSLHLQFIWQFNEDSWFRLIKMFSYFLFYPNTLFFFCIAIFIRQRRLYCQTEDLFIFHKIGDKRNRFIFQSQSFLTVIKFFTGSNIGFQKCYSDHLPAFLNFKCMVYGQFGLYLHTEYWLFVENII